MEVGLEGQKGYVVANALGSQKLGGLSCEPSPEIDTQIVDAASHDVRTGSDVEAELLGDGFA
jgi:hypothetical protein